MKISFSQNYNLINNIQRQNNSKNSSISSINRGQFVSFKKFETNGPVYSIDINGNYRKYEQAFEASEKLGIENSSISRCLKGERYTADIYTFVRADEVEVKNPDGSIVVDQEKVRQIKKERIDNNFVPFYLIDRCQNYHRYLTNSEAAKEVGLSHSCIGSWRRKKPVAPKHYITAEAKDIEIKNPDGSITVDKKKIRELVESSFSPIGIYIVSPSGIYEKFDSVQQISDELQLNRENIFRCLAGKLRHTGGYCFIKAEDVEKMDFDKNETIVDKEKILEFAREKFKNAKGIKFINS